MNHVIKITWKSLFWQSYWVSFCTLGWRVLLVLMCTKWHPSFLMFRMIGVVEAVLCPCSLQRSQLPVFLLFKPRKRFCYSKTPASGSQIIETTANEVFRIFGMKMWSLSSVWFCKFRFTRADLRLKIIIKNVVFVYWSFFPTFGLFSHYFLSCPPITVIRFSCINRLFL